MFIEEALKRSNDIYAVGQIKQSFSPLSVEMQSKQGVFSKYNVIDVTHC